MRMIRHGENQRRKSEPEKDADWKFVGACMFCSFAWLVLLAIAMAGPI